MSDSNFNEVARLESKVAESEKRLLQMQQQGSSLIAKVDAAEREISTLRGKFDHLSSQKAEENKTDWKLVLYLLFGLFGLAGSGWGLLTATADSLTKEIAEAKASASSAKSGAKEHADQQIGFVQSQLDAMSESRFRADQGQALAEQISKLKVKVDLLALQVPSPSQWADHTARSRSMETAITNLQGESTDHRGKIERVREYRADDKALYMSIFDDLRGELSTITSDMKTDDGRMDSLASQIGSLRSGIAGAISEIEAQFRGTNAYLNSLVANLRQIDQILGDACAVNVPEIDYYSEGIPAQAFIRIGDINGAH